MESEVDKKVTERSHNNTTTDILNPSFVISNYMEYLCHEAILHPQCWNSKLDQHLNYYKTLFENDSFMDLQSGSLACRHDLSVLIMELYTLNLEEREPEEWGDCYILIHEMNDMLVRKDVTRRIWPKLKSLVTSENDEDDIGGYYDDDHDEELKRQLLSSTRFKDVMESYHVNWALSYIRMARKLATNETVQDENAIESTIVPDITEQFSHFINTNDYFNVNPILRQLILVKLRFQPNVDDGIPNTNETEVSSTQNQILLSNLSHFETEKYSLQTLKKDLISELQLWYKTVFSDAPNQITLTFGIENINTVEHIHVRNDDSNDDVEVDWRMEENDAEKNSHQSNNINNDDDDTSESHRQDNTMDEIKLLRETRSKLTELTKEDPINSVLDIASKVKQHDKHDANSERDSNSSPQTKNILNVHVTVPAAADENDTERTNNALFNLDQSPIIRQNDSFSSSKESHQLSNDSRQDAIVPHHQTVSVNNCSIMPLPPQSPYSSSSSFKSAMGGSSPENKDKTSSSSPKKIQRRLFHNERTVPFESQRNKTIRKSAREDRNNYDSDPLFDDDDDDETQKENQQVHNRNQGKINIQPTRNDDDDDSDSLFDDTPIDTIRSTTNTTTTGVSTAQFKKRKRIMFTQAEKDAIIQGYKRFGTQWSRIKCEYNIILKNRSNVNIKDCFRSLERNNLIDTEE